MELLKLEPFQETLHASMCGPASLKIVLNYYGVDKSEEELAMLTNATESGTDDASIVHAAESLGFKAVIKDESNFRD